MQKKDALVAGFFDPHSGSNHALFPNRFWQGKDGRNHSPTGGQERIYQQFVKYGAEIKGRRKGKKLVLVVGGDAIEGYHHEGDDICTRDYNEQAAIHIEVLGDFQKMVNWQAGDLLFYLSGTKTHVADIENEIGQQMNAYQFDTGRYVAEKLELEINGALLWLTHHGVKPGRGGTMGNALRNNLAAIYYDCLRDGKRLPDFVGNGHNHVKGWGSYTSVENDNCKTMFAMTFPSWQEKNRYAYGVAPYSMNHIGGGSFVVTADGQIVAPQFCTLETQSSDYVKV